MKTIEWPMCVRTPEGGTKTVLVKIADMVTKAACNDAAALVLEAHGYDAARVAPFHQGPPRPTFTHDELMTLAAAITEHVENFPEPDNDDERASFERQLEVAEAAREKLDAYCASLAEMG